MVEQRLFLFLSHLHSSTLLMHAADDNDVVIAIELCHRTDADGRRLMLFEWVGDDRIRAVAPRRLDRSDLRPQ